MQPTIVIVGAGQAGFQVAVSLRELGYSGRVVLAGAEPHAPYQRPPLSKGYLLGDVDELRVALRPPAFFDKHHIELLMDKHATAIDRAGRRVLFQDGSAVAYDHLVLATGARNRELAVPGADLRGVCYLRTLAEAAALRERMATARAVVVIGAGFVGLEFAAVAVKHGLQVTVLDVAERPMARALSRTMSSVCAREHGQMGIRLALRTGVKRLLGDQDGHVRGLVTADGQLLAADLVVIGIGVLPNVELAVACDLPIDNGIVIDDFLRTGDPQISAIGDVAAHVCAYGPGQRLRLESVQNASDQGRYVAQRLTGQTAPYGALPWFWSHQGHLRLQMAGLAGEDCAEVVRGDPSGTACSVFLFRAGRLVAVESLNRAADHMLARRLLSQRVAVTPQQAADGTFDLKALLPAAGAGSTLGAG